MKTQELRIGNFLHDRENRLCKVEEIKEEQFYAPAIKGGMTGLPNNAIPLTEQWLIDLGFRKDEETNYRWFIEDWLAYDLDDNCIRISDSWEFGKRKYVHELQNLYFALTGKELTLNQET